MVLHILLWLLVGVLAAAGRSLDKYLSVPFSILVSRLNYGVWAFSSPEHTYGRTDNRVRRSPYSHKGNIGESDGHHSQQAFMHRLYIS